MNRGYSNYWRWARQGVFSYSGVHNRIKKFFGPAKDQACSCGNQAAEWAYIGGSPFERVGDNGGYPHRFSPRTTDYVAMCKMCHERKDKGDYSSFCKRGHDKDVVGRGTKGDSCGECNRLSWIRYREKRKVMQNEDNPAVR